MDNDIETVKQLPSKTDSKTSWGFMIAVSIGHGVKHFYQQAFLLLIPYVKSYLGLSDVQIGLIGATKTIIGATINIPAGILADMWRTKVSLMLTASMICLALGYLIIGITPSYWLLLVGVSITGSGASFWHAPAFGTLAAMYPERKATAFSFHRMGGSLGDSIAPIIVGVLLGGFAFWGIEWSGLHWQTLSLIMVIPASVCAIGVFFFLRTIQGSIGNQVSLGTYLHSAKGLLTNSSVVSMVALSGVRSMAHNGLSLFLVIYMSEDLGFTDFQIGYHVALLTLLGVASAPAIGWASDKFGRRRIIFISLLSMTILIFAFLPFGTGIAFTLILALLGIFLYSVNPVMLAAAMDGAEKGTEGSGIALMFTGTAIMGAISPIIAGRLKEIYGMDGVFYYSAIIVGIVTIASLFVPMGKNSNLAESDLSH